MLPEIAEILAPSHFIKITSGIDVSGVNAELAAHPELWNMHPARTQPGSPHFGVSDIWVRFRAPEELGDLESYRVPHVSQFYPAWYALPSLEAIIMSLMVKCGAVALGGILITRIPPGGSVKPHHDRGSWHAEFYNCKVYVGLQENPRCVNYCEGESIVIAEGDAVVFNNLLTHSVENRGDTPRTTLIVCMRTEPCHLPQ